MQTHSYRRLGMVSVGLTIRATRTEDAKNIILVTWALTVYTSIAALEIDFDNGLLLVYLTWRHI